MTKHSEQNGKACTQQHVVITAADLPLSCPPRDKRVWDAHPRVYLTISGSESTACPYCGTMYTLTEVETR